MCIIYFDVNFCSVAFNFPDHHQVWSGSTLDKSLIPVENRPTVRTKDPWPCMNIPHQAWSWHYPYPVHPNGGVWCPGLELPHTNPGHEAPGTLIPSTFPELFPYIVPNSCPLLTKIAVNKFDWEGGGCWEGHGEIKFWSPIQTNKRSRA